MKLLSLPGRGEVSWCTGNDLRRSPSVPRPRLLRTRRCAKPQLAELRGNEIDVVSMDGKTVRGVWEQDEQLKLMHLFSLEGSMALDQVEIAHHLDEPRAAEEWIRTVSAHFAGLRVLSGDALYADTNLAEAILAEGKDYVVKLKKTNPSSWRTHSSPSPR